MELWGGVECTVNRVGDRYGDQIRATGHHDRAEDMARLADLGLAAIRFPVLWERVSPGDPGRCDWRWSDARLDALRARDIRAIVGLVHHGSGPLYTDLLAGNFATGLARHARSVAERYPWVEDWTPVNEPCTTARFSCLYGHWYPHHREERSFWLALLNQVDATCLAMAAVRTVNPHARLIQTDDLGRTYATAAVRDQAAFDNVRRWMGWDLLAGRVTRDHPFWDRLVGMGLGDRLRAIADRPCPPDIIGINHYLTSDRLLDHRVRHYPARADQAGHRFFDTEAVRALAPPSPGLAGVLREAWGRYRIPLAVTEVHNGSTREEQMRWTRAAWETALALRRDGIDIRAVTSWALFGSTGWNSLLTSEGVYEPGAYDVRGPSPRPTAMVPLLRALAAGATPAHPVLGGQGWWQRPIRLHHAPVPRPAPMRDHLAGARTASAAAARPILIAGATGMLGQALAAACRHRDIAHILTARAELDLASGASIAAALDRHRPWVVINAAGWPRVDEAESASDAWLAANAAGAARLAAACAERGIASVYFSSDRLFDGRAGRPYVERDPPSPLCALGRSTLLAEQVIGTMEGTHLIVRTAALFSPFDPHNLAAQAMRAFAAGQPFAADCDRIVSPTYLPDLCDAVLDLTIDGAAGVWHLAGDEALAPAAFARRLAAAAGLDETLVINSTGRDLTAPSPAATPLGSERGMLLPPLATAIDRFIGVMRANGALPPIPRSDRRSADLSYAVAPLP